eukprot:749666-Hanusia_phi.AAC.6
MRIVQVQGGRGGGRGGPGEKWDVGPGSARGEVWLGVRRAMGRDEPMSGQTERTARKSICPSKCVCVKI